MPDTSTHSIVRETRPVPLAELNLYYRNPRRGDISAIASSLARNGQYRAVVVNVGSRTGRANEVLCGNHTVMSARLLDWDTVDASFVDLDEAEAARVVLADNRTSELATDDSQVLAELLQEFDGDLDGTGWTGEDLEGLLAELEAAAEVPAEPLTDPDDVPEPGPDPVSRPGDVWQLGRHRVVCGDATDVGAYDVLLGGEKADLVWTDPPYGVAVVGGSRALTPDQRRSAGGMEIDNDALGTAGLTDFLRAAFGATLTASKPGAPWYVAAPDGPRGLAFSVVLTELDVWRATLIWVKNSLVLGRGDYHSRHEPIYYGWRPGAARLHPVEDRSQDSVWEIPRPARNDVHPTMKPVALITRALENSSDPGALVLDCFGGSGSTLIAAEATGRAARLIELDQRYVDVICRRFEEFTGITPLRVQDGGEPVPVSFTTSPAAAA